MKKMSAIDRILLLLAGLLAAYQIVFGIEGAPALSIWAYTLAFGTLLLAGLLLIIFGFEILDNPLVTVVSTMLPLSLSLGLVWEHWPAWRNAYLVFVVVGFIAVAFTRFYRPGKAAVITLAVVHSVAGLLIFLLPIYMSLRGLAPAGFVFVGIGGALIGVGGLLLSFLKMGKPVISRQMILTILPLLLLLMTAAYVVGFYLD
ncbi:MAG: hypothetical protein LC131_11845 [Anaerolineae bacterium]|nr:hypothetical protein [Anaerolineae bacterium]